MWLKVLCVVFRLLGEVVVFCLICFWMMKVVVDLLLLG